MRSLVSATDRRRPPVLLLMSLAFVGSCSGDSGADPGPTDTTVAAVTLTADRDEGVLGVHRHITVRAVATNAGGDVLPGVSYTWSSDDPEVATVDGEGVVSLVGSGTVEVTAAAGDVMGSIDLTVTDTPGGSVAVVGASLLSMEDGALQPERTVIVVDGLITEVGPSVDVTVPTGIPVLDGTGYVLVSGLSDMHVHPTQEGDLVPYVASGVTTVLDMGNGFHNTVMAGWKGEVHAGTRLGPNILVAANVRAPSDQGDPRTLASNPAEGRAFVRAHLDFDFIKVYNGLSTATFDAIVEEASIYGLTVIGHGVRAPGMSAILAGGLEMVAHAEEFFFTSFGSNTGASDDQIQAVTDELLAAGAYVTATLSINEAFAILWGNPAGLDELRQRPGYAFMHSVYKDEHWPTRATNFTGQTSGSWRSVLEFEMKFLERFHDAGVPLLLGTDSPPIPGMVPGFSLHEDLRLHVEMGLTRLEALRLGTVNAGAFVAEYRPGAEPFGRIAAGFRGDMLLVPGNPLDDLDLLRRPEYVVVRGRVHTRADLDEALEALRN